MQICYQLTSNLRKNSFFAVVCITAVALVACHSVNNSDQMNLSKKQLTQTFNQLSNQPLTAEQNANHFNKLSAVKTLDCGSLQTGKAITLIGHNQIPKDCELWQKNTHFIIEQNDTSLDCQGVSMSATDADLTAITIRTPNDHQAGIHNIRINNCALSGYGHGVVIEQKTPANVRYEELLQQQTTLEQQRAQSPHDILLNRILVNGSKNSGVFIGDHVQHVTLANSRVQNSGTVGVYLEFGSGHNQIIYSQFNGNGFRQLNMVGMGIGKPNREAIAVDSSANNLIAHNQFDGNGAGGIFLYRNCFEHADDATQTNHFLRTQGSNNNQILYNTFNHEPVGIWVAARQSRNLKGFACGAYLIKSDMVSSYHLDESEQNSLFHNQFNRLEKAIILEDDNNVVSFNQFSPNVKLPISVGSKIREQSNQGVVKGNQLNDNIFATTDPITQLIEFIGKSSEHNLHCNNITTAHQRLDNVCLVN